MYDEQTIRVNKKQILYIRSVRNELPVTQQVYVYGVPFVHTTTHTGWVGGHFNGSSIKKAAIGKLCKTSSIGTIHEVYFIFSSIILRTPYRTEYIDYFVPKTSIYYEYGMNYRKK